MRVKVSDLRANLQKYIDEVESGTPLDITVRGKAVVRMIPIADVQTEAKKWLLEARKHSWVGDVVSPLNVKWNADSGNDS